MDEYLRDRQWVINKYKNLLRYLKNEKKSRENIGELIDGQIYMCKQIIKDLEEKI